MKKPKILIIYTGGTIGMINDPETNMLKPFDFDQITKEVPELMKIKCSLDAVSFKKPIDSSNMNLKIWKKLGDYIWKNYEKYSGFVILHGSDTMAYTASALSFMFKNLTKPIIFTGSQLPIGTIRTDGKENLITAIEIASTLKNGVSLIQEVAIYFEYQLYRANRTTKVSSEDFEAFKSFNYPTLAEAGIHIKFNERNLLRPKDVKTTYNAAFDSNLAIVHLFPGIDLDNFQYAIGNPKIRAIILLTFGSGNAPTDSSFLKILKEQLKKGKVIINLTQCNGGSVQQGKYETSDQLLKMGVVGAKDMTLESVITKLMIILGQYKSENEIKKAFVKSISGEILE
jgi:L-asparaginase